MKRLIGLSIAILTASSMLSSATAADRQLNHDTYALQYDFGTATDLIIEPKWQSVPEDAAAKLKHIAAHFGAAPTFANIGEEWSPDDFFRVDLPRAQHLFSAYSDRIAVSVFVRGGSELTVYAVLARRHAESYCIFKLPPLGLYTLRVSIVQYELRPDRDQTISAIPKCQAQSLEQPLQLASGG